MMSKNNKASVDIMSEAIEGMIKNIFSDDPLYQANFRDYLTCGPVLDRFMPGKILTFGDLKNKPEGAVIHILYKNDDGNVSTDDFYNLFKDDEQEEWCAGGYFPFPVKGLTDDVLMKDLDNSGHEFTIRDAVPAKKGEFAKVKESIATTSELTSQLIELHNKYIKTSDKFERKSIKKEMSVLEKKVNKILGLK